MSQPFLGEIRLFPYNFAPRGWAFCSGQILPIAQNTALFALLGTTYGGNGQTTFALPDLRGRKAISSGQGPGLSNYDLGQVSGAENATLTINQMPGHSHVVKPNAVKDDVNAQNPQNTLPANGAFYSNAAATVQMGPSTSELTGGSQPFAILDPYLTLNYCIALQGIFPSRN